MDYWEIRTVAKARENWTDNMAPQRKVEEIIKNVNEVVSENVSDKKKGGVSF